MMTNQHKTIFKKQKVKVTLSLTGLVADAGKLRRLSCSQDKWNLHGGKTTMLYLNLSGHDIFKTRFGTSPEKHCLTATPYRLFQGNLQNLHKIGT